MSMSFFDEVETTVANTRFLQAVEDSGPVKLSLQPYEELGQLATTLQAEVTLPQLLKPKTMGRYLFKQFLKEPLREKSSKVVDRQILFAFLEAVEEFSTAKTHERAAKGKAIYDIYLKYGGSRQAAVSGLPPMSLEVPEAEYDEDEGPETSQALREYDDDDGDGNPSERRRSRSTTLLMEQKGDKKQADVHLHLSANSKRVSTVSSNSPTESSNISSSLPLADISEGPPPPPPPPPPSPSPGDINPDVPQEAAVEKETHKVPPPPPPVPESQACLAAPHGAEERRGSRATSGARRPEASHSQETVREETKEAVSEETKMDAARPPSTSSASLPAPRKSTAQTGEAPQSNTQETPATPTETPTGVIPATIVVAETTPAAENAPATIATQDNLASPEAREAAKSVTREPAKSVSREEAKSVTREPAKSTDKSAASPEGPPAAAATNASEPEAKGASEPAGTKRSDAETKSEATTQEAATTNDMQVEEDPAAKLELKVTVEGENPGLRSRVASVDRPMDEMSFGSLASLVKRIDNMDAILNDLVRQLGMTPPPADTFFPITDAFARILQAEHMTEDFLASPQWKRYVQLRAYVKKRLTLDNFRIFRVLGRGAFGAVSAVQKIDSHAIFAMKEMGKRQVKHQQSEWVCVNERRVLAKMKSPFVLNLKYSFHTSENLYLIFDMCSGGDLKFHLRNEKMRCFSLERARFYAAEVLLGLEHIHSLNIVYRDLKPTNILLDEEGHCVISDLGLTVHLKKNKLIKHLAGTAGYWAPEILQKAGTYKTSDYWSFGVMLYEMILGRRPTCKCSKKDPQWCPFGQSRSMEQFALKEDGVLVLDVDYPRELPADAVDLLKKLFEPNPEKRIGTKGAAEIKAHPFFKSVDWAKLENKEITPPFKPDNHTVNANSIGEVGETNKAKYRKIKLLDEDEKHYEDFDFINMEALEAEMVTALIKMDAPPPPMKDVPRGNANGTGCCAVS